ncbi:PaaI family thioesterase [Paracoccus indicus]|uniref:PaaI family thioesterase n=1 Tax=Paracoccus indicus TaxID=2079229 RepID=UPI001FE8F1EC|nr:PaaI family thioesterase [Paracoccus indicus]
MPHDEPLHGDIIRRVEESFAAQGLMQHLGVEIACIRPGEVTLRLPYDARLTQHHGFFHAGATSALADTAGGFAGFTQFPPDSSVLTTEFKMNLLAPARGECLIAVGRVIRSGRTLTVCQLDVHAQQGDDRTHVATGLQTLICLPASAPESPPRDTTPGLS